MCLLFSILVIILYEMFGDEIVGIIYPFFLRNRIIVICDKIIFIKNYFRLFQLFLKEIVLEADRLQTFQTTCIFCNDLQEFKYESEA